MDVINTNGLSEYEVMRLPNGTFSVELGNKIGRNNSPTHTTSESSPSDTESLDLGRHLEDSDFSSSPSSSNSTHGSISNPNSNMGSKRGSTLALMEAVYTPCSTLYINVIGGSRIILNVSPLYTISNIKSMIHDQLLIAPSQIALYWARGQLENNELLEDLLIGDHATLEAIVWTDGDYANPIRGLESRQDTPASVYTSRTSTPVSDSGYNSVGKQDSQSESSRSETPINGARKPLGSDFIHRFPCAKIPNPSVSPNNNLGKSVRSSPQSSTNGFAWGKVPTAFTNNKYTVKHTAFSRDPSTHGFPWEKVPNASAPPPNNTYTGRSISSPRSSSSLSPIKATPIVRPQPFKPSPGLSRWQPSETIRLVNTTPRDFQPITPLTRTSHRFNSPSPISQDDIFRRRSPTNIYSPSRNSNPAPSSTRTFQNTFPKNPFPPPHRFQVNTTPIQPANFNNPPNYLPRTQLHAQSSKNIPPLAREILPPMLLETRTVQQLIALQGDAMTAQEWWEVRAAVENDGDAQRNMEVLGRKLMFPR